MPFRDVAIEAVVFDWGGTLSTFATAVRVESLWEPAAAVLEPHTPHSREEIAACLATVEDAFWQRTSSEHPSGGTLNELIAEAHERLDVTAPADALEAAARAYLDAWEPHIEHDEDATETLTALRDRGIRTGMLSNTHWPRDYHERFLARDGLVELLDARLYTSELDYMKPHPSAFEAALDALGVADPSRAIFVGDRPWDDIFGAQRAGLRTALRTNPLVPGYDVEPDVEIARLRELLTHLGDAR